MVFELDEFEGEKSAKIWKNGGGRLGKIFFRPLPHENDCNFAPVPAILLIFCVWLSNNQLSLITMIVHVLQC